MTYIGIPVAGRGFLLVFATLIQLMYIYCIIRMIDIKRYKPDLVLTVIMAVSCFIILQMMTMIQQGDLKPSFEIPMVLLCPALLLLLCFVIFQLYHISRWRRQHISAMSVKEAFDKLPAGLMSYSAGGIPVMVNETMQEISREMFAESIRDGETYWKIVRKTMTNDDVPEDKAIVKSGSGKAYSFKNSLLNIKGAEIYELTAVDISDEYELSRKLADGQEKARVLNTRLKALMGTIEYVTMNRELLALKSSLHDNIGQCILIAKRYMYSPESVDKQRMLDFWRDNIRHLTNDEPEEWELPYYVISKEADRLGIKLNIIGELPSASELIPVVDAAISVHIGNTLKHADGTEATVAVKKTADGVEISFTNNGRQPEGEITEKGGLKNLRSQVEGAGGRMEIISQPAFEMKLTLPEP